MPARTGATSTPATQLVTSQKLYIENTLLRVSGALFCHDAKRAPEHTSEIFLDRGSSESTITIRPDTKLGQPGPLAHKVFLALIKKHSDSGRPIHSEISFTRREIGRLIGRTTWGGKDSEQLSRALHEIHYTFIKAHFKSSAGRLVEHSFNIFPQIWIERREFACDPIEACTVTLAEPIIASLRDDHFTCLNHDLLTQLGTIGQALYMRLFFHFANLFDGGNPNALRFQKRYDDICVEWLGRITVLKHRSKIITEQLGSHLDKLVACGFLTAYAIEPSRLGNGFVVTFHPGKEFFNDYNRFYSRRQTRRQSQSKTGSENRVTGDPLRVAYMFAQKRSGAPTPVEFVPSKDVEIAKVLLEQIPIDDMPAFLDYALASARKTAFDVQTLGGLKQYVTTFKDGRNRKEAAIARKAAQAASEAEEAERHTYDEYRTTEAMRVFETLPADQQEALAEQASLHRASHEGPFKSLNALVAQRRLAALVAERHGGSIKTFEEWRSASSRRALPRGF
jgi:hypothetical protein